MSSLWRGVGPRSMGLGLLFLVLLVGDALMVGAPVQARGNLPEWMESLGIDEAFARFPEDDIVQLYGHRTVKVDRSGKRGFRVRTAFHVRRGDGKGHESVFFSESVWRKLKRLKGWRQDSRGEVDVFDELLTSQALGGELYSDAKVISLIIPEVGAGDLFGFELRFEEKMSELGSVRVPIRTRIPILAGRIDLQLPGGWRAEGLWIDPVRAVATAYAPIDSSEGRWSWIWNDQPGSEDPEPFEPNDERLIPFFVVRYEDPSGRAATMRDWKAVSEWYGPYSLSALEGQDRLGETAQQAVGGATADPDRIAGIADFVRSSIAYVQIYLGDGGWRPHKAEDVYRNRFGDCKDMAHLAIALLEKQGFSAYPVLTSTVSGSVWPELPSPYFNHCIVAIDDRSASGRYRFFDPTAKDVPYGRLPAALEGAWGLVVGSPSDTGLVRLPRSGPEENLRILTASVEVSTSLSGTGWVDETLVGQPAFRLRGYLRGRSPEKSRQARERRLGRRFPGARVGAWSTSGIEGVSDTVRLRYQLELPGFARKAGRFVFLCPDFLTAQEQEAFPAAERTNAIVLPYPYRTETVIDLSLPEGWMAEEIPSDVALENRFGRFDRSYTVRGDTVRLVRLEEARLSELPVEDYSLARAWGRACFKADRERLVVRPR